LLSLLTRGGYGDHAVIGYLIKLGLCRGGENQQQEWEDEAVAALLGGMRLHEGACLRWNNFTDARKTVRFHGRKVLNTHFHHTTTAAREQSLKRKSFLTNDGVKPGVGEPFVVGGHRAWVLTEAHEEEDLPAPKGNGVKRAGIFLRWPYGPSWRQALKRIQNSKPETRNKSKARMSKIRDDSQ
jgi:hypothetical protein